MPGWGPGGREFESPHPDVDQAELLRKIVGVLDAEEAALDRHDMAAYEALALQEYELFGELRVMWGIDAG